MSRCPAASPTYSVVPRARREAPRRHLVASAVPSAAAEERGSVVTAPGRRHRLLDCPVPPLPRIEEAHLASASPPGSAASGPLTPSTTAFLCPLSPVPGVFFQSSSSFPKRESRRLLRRPILTPAPFSPGHSSATRIPARPGARGYSAPSTDLALLGLVKTSRRFPSAESVSGPRPRRAENPTWRCLSFAGQRLVQEKKTETCRM